jgi:hypothetical protein
MGRTPLEDGPSADSSGRSPIRGFAFLIPAASACGGGVGLRIAAPVAAERPVFFLLFVSFQRFFRLRAVVAPACGLPPAALGPLLFRVVAAGWFPGR